MFEYKFWHVYFFSFLGYLHVSFHIFITFVDKRDRCKYVGAIHERIVRDNENNGQSNLFKSGVPSARAIASNPRTKHTDAPLDVSMSVVGS